MANYPIDLGKSGPCYGMEPMKMSEEKYYPSLHLEGDSEIDLPSEGTMTIKFRKTHETESKNRDGKEHYSCSFEILSIEDVTPSKSEDDEDESTEDVLDGYVKEAKKKGAK